MAKQMRYDELRALALFVNAVKVYPYKKIDDSFFIPFARCERNEKWVYAMQDELDPDEHRRRYRPPLYEILEGLWSMPENREEVRRRIVARAQEILRRYKVGKRIPVEQKRLDRLADFVKLDATQKKVLEVCWLFTTERILERTNLPYGGQRYEHMAMLTGLDEMSIREALSVNEPLHRFGIIGSDSSWELSDTAQQFMGGTLKDLTSAFYKVDNEKPLPAKFFGEISEKHLPVLEKLLKGENGKGVNIVLYGASGTGKTSFARMLAKTTGRRLLTVAQGILKNKGEFTAVKSQDRCTALRVCSEHADAEKDLILVDEADNLLGDWDKGTLNVILEQTTAPVVWVANVRAGAIDRSVHRRFDYSIKFEPFDREGRERIWTNAVKKAHVKLGKSEIAKLAADYAVNAGVIAKALENARKVGGDIASGVRKFLGQAVELSNAKSAVDREKNTAPAGDYSLEGLNIIGDIPLENIVECVRNFCSGDYSAPDAPRMNILLSGPAGTGKTEFVKYLASAVKRPLEVVTGSQLLDKWVGGTEKNIAQAFSRAKEHGAVLFLDEIDSFLQDRASSDHSWEVTQVNELLQQMESFGGVMIGATNFADRLDRAVSRRFTFKLKLDYLRPEGRLTFFERFFGMTPTEAAAKRLAAIGNLTPGDYRTARQSLYYLGGKRTEEDYIAALERESEAKRAMEPHIVGFNV